MGFADPALASLRGVAADAFGDYAVLTVSGSSYTVKGIKRREPVTLLDGNGAPYQDVREVFDISEEELDGLMPAADNVDSLAIGGTTWTFTGIERGPVGTWILVLGRPL